MRLSPPPYPYYRRSLSIAAAPTGSQISHNKILLHHSAPEFLLMYLSPPIWCQLSLSIWPPQTSHFWSSRLSSKNISRLEPLEYYLSHCRCPLRITFLVSMLSISHFSPWSRPEVHLRDQPPPSASRNERLFCLSLLGIIHSAKIATAFRSELRPSVYLDIIKSCYWKSCWVPRSGLSLKHTHRLGNRDVALLPNLYYIASVANMWAGREIEREAR